ncbi:nuclease [Rhodotorula kratochvilovae]
MSSSILHLGLAVVSGVALGAAGAISLRKDSPRAAPAPAGQGAPPLAGGQGAGGAQTQVLAGARALKEVGDRVVNGGTIGPISDLFFRQAYTVAYDRRLRIPSWTAEHLTKASLKSGGGDRQTAIFREDEAIPEAFRAKLTDYFRSGYGALSFLSLCFRVDGVVSRLHASSSLRTTRLTGARPPRSPADRGHMVPAADAKQSQEAMGETFLLSNIAPQVGDGFNRHYWAYLEAVRRKL